MKREKSREMVMQYFGGNGELLLECRLFSTPLHEKAVLRVCLEFFDDPEPCMLHRSAAMSRMYMEMLEFFQRAQKDNSTRFSYSDLPVRIAGFINISSCREIVITTPE